MDYRCEATTLDGFVQQVAVSYFGHGYWFYVTGHVPEGKDPGALDRKLIERYGIARSKWARARRKKAGGSNLQYIRYGRLFVLLATHGDHWFFKAEAKAIRDARKHPLKVGPYSISHRNGHSCIRLELGEYRRLKARFLELAKHREGEGIFEAFCALPYQPYAPVRQQLLAVWRAVNRARAESGWSEVSIQCIPYRRRIVKPFEPRAEDEKGREDGTHVRVDAA